MPLSLNFKLSTYQTYKKGILFLLILPATLPYSWGQTLDGNVEKNQSSLGLSLGFAHYRVLDEGLTFNKLIFKGTLPKVKFDYRKETAKSVFGVYLAASGGKLRPKKAHIPCSLISLDLSLAYARKIADMEVVGFESKLFAGLQLGSLLYYLDSQQWLDNEDLLTLQQLHITALQQIELTASSHIQIKVALPTVAFAKRLILDGGLHEPLTKDSKALHILWGGSRVTFANTAHFQVEYIKKVSPRTSFNINYRFEYLKNSMHRPLRLYSNELLVGLHIILTKHEK